MKRTLCATLALALVVSGCAGRDAVVAPSVEASDGRMSCRQITAEVVEVENKVSGLMAEKSGKTGWNVGVGVVTALVFWPALFLADLGEAERAELDGHRRRLAHLEGLKARRGCP